MTLSQEFWPMTAQLSLEAELLLDEMILTASDRCGDITGLILGVRPANEKEGYFVVTFIIGWV